MLIPMSSYILSALFLPQVCWLSFLRLATHEFCNRKGVSGRVFNQMTNGLDIPFRIFTWRVV